MGSFKTIEFADEKLILLDQTKLPLAEEYISTDDHERAAVAIERLEVRGAPAIGVAAAYAIALGMKNSNGKNAEQFGKVFHRLKITRPTAVNLFWALEEMKKAFDESSESDDIYKVLLQKAKEIHQDDIDKCDGMAENGLQIFKKRSVVLTHCNTGQLATGGGGTAFYVIKNAFENNLVEFVYADETRPLLQGSRLTAFELEKAGIPFAINTDSTAAFLMKQNKIDLVITGADRIAANADSANKIGTYNLAVLCKHHNIPFYIVAPTSTVDLNCKDGSKIKIEERNKREVTEINGTQVTKNDYGVYSPAFDVTPAELIAGIITEEKLHSPPYKF
jgi:methylthioribose-1-phosphate isomerase